MDDTYVLRMEGIGKEYSGVPVLHNVDLQVRAGEVVSIVGENGAGKSTLMNILFGMPVIHESGGFVGQIKLEEKPVEITSPQVAIELGIGMVHQEFMMIPNFTVTENIKINRENTRPNLLSRAFGKQMETLDHEKNSTDARVALNKMGMQSLDEMATVDGMPVGYMQFIECAREIDKTNIKLIVFDEPTAVLTEVEAKQLLEAIKEIAASGIGIIFISHKLDEVISISDRIVVMQDGELVASLEKSQTNAVELAELMVGRSMDSDSLAAPRDFSAAQVIMSIRDLKVLMPGELVKGIDLDIKEGEILGIAGLAGHGKIGIANGIMGLYETSGTVVYKNEPLNIHSTYDVMNRRINFVSEDRKSVGLILENSIEQNIVTPALRAQKEYLRNFGIFTQYDRKAARRQAEKMIEELRIKCTSPAQRVGALSGGNQQKVCIAEALTLEPEFLFISEPTRGIDIGAKTLILDYLKKINREQGMTIVVTSSELKELRSICDRIIIVANGKIIGQLAPDASNVEYGLMMSGIVPEQVKLEEAR